MYRVYFFTGEHTVVEGDTESEVIENVWLWTSAKIEHLEPLGNNGRQDENLHQEG